MTPFLWLKRFTIGDCIRRFCGDLKKVGSLAFVATMSTCRIPILPTTWIGNHVGGSARISHGIRPSFQKSDCSTIRIFWRRTFSSRHGKSSRSFSSGSSSSVLTVLTNSKLMKQILLILSAILACAFSAEAKLNVVATLPDFGAVAREIGGDKVAVTVLAKPTEDSHFVDARPSFVVQLRTADVLIEGGAELELGWLPPLLQNARNPKIEVGKPGRVQASQGIRLMGVPTTLTRAAGDVHALGNPHFMIDPIIAKAVAKHIAQAFSAVDSANAATYDANYKKFEATINSKLQQWGATLLPFKGQPVAAYHESWVYFAHRFGFNIDIFLEPKPGIPPSPSHLVEVIEKMKAAHVKAILVEPYHNRKIAEKVAASTGAKVVDVAQFPGALPNTDTYVKLIDALVSRIAAAMK